MCFDICCTRCKGAILRKEDATDVEGYHTSFTNTHASVELCQTELKREMKLLHQQAENISDRRTSLWVN